MPPNLDKWEHATETEEPRFHASDVAMLSSSRHLMDATDYNRWTFFWNYLFRLNNVNLTIIVEGRSLMWGYLQTGFHNILTDTGI